jgi:glucose-1-phosphate thymidylyltransferase
VEELAYRMGYIDSTQITTLASAMNKTRYGEYLLRLVSGGKNG